MILYHTPNKIKNYTSYENITLTSLFNKEDTPKYTKLMDYPKTSGALPIKYRQTQNHPFSDAISCLVLVSNKTMDKEEYLIFNQNPMKKINHTDKRK